MKKLFVLLVVFFAAIFFGCQENSITDPITDSSADIKLPDAEITFGIDKDIVSYYPNFIKLFGFLQDPSHRPNATVQIKGILRYKHVLVTNNSTDPAAQSYVALETDLNARLYGGCGSGGWLATGRTSENIIYTPNNIAATYVQKSFRVKNNCCGTLDLVLKFRVTEKSLVLDSMWLKKVSGPVPVGDPVI